MRVRFGALSLLVLSVALVAVLLSPGVSLAQSMDDVGPSAALSVALVLFLVVLGLGFYVYMALALQTIAAKTRTENAWLAWIPIANLVLLLMIAKKPVWWLLLFLIPLVSIVIAIIVWMGVAEARGKPNWWGILMIVPLVNFVVPGYLAWAD